MPQIDPSAPYAIKVGVSLTVFLLSLVAWAILLDMIAPGTSRAARTTRVVYTMLSAIGLIFLTSQDVGFFFSAVAVLTSGLFQTFSVFTSLEQLSILAGGFCILIGSSYYLTNVAPPAVSGFYHEM
jgi:hypothetical protein